MTFIILLVAMGSRTPVLMWIVAMGCDTLMLTTYMVLKAMGKL